MILTHARDQAMRRLIRGEHQISIAQQTVG